MACCRSASFSPVAVACCCDFSFNENARQMPVNLESKTQPALHPVPGVKLGTTMAGIRKVGRRDLTVVLLDEGASVAGVFTSNRFCAAPVQLCRAHLASGLGPRAILVNTGNANAGTGEDGLARARATCPFGTGSMAR